MKSRFTTILVFIYLSIFCFKLSEQTKKSFSSYNNKFKYPFREKNIALNAKLKGKKFDSKKVESKMAKDFDYLSHCETEEECNKIFKQYIINSIQLEGVKASVSNKKMLNEAERNDLDWNLPKKPFKWG